MLLPLCLRYCRQRLLKMRRHAAIIRLLLIYSAATAITFDAVKMDALCCLVCCRLFAADARYAYALLC